MRMEPGSNSLDCVVQTTCTVDQSFTRPDISVMSQNTPTLIRIDHDRLFKWLFAGLIAIEISLVLLDAFISEYEWVSIGAARRLFNITREDGVPNFFSSSQLLVAGVVLLLITVVARSQSRGSNSKVVVGWGVMAALFLYMGIDDATKLHERVGSIFKALVTDASGEAHSGFLGDLYEVFPSYPWQLVFGPLLVVMGVFLIMFLFRQLPSLRLKALIVVAIGLFIVAVAMDFIEGMDNNFSDQVAELFSTSPERVVHFSKSIEEFFEMAGNTIFLFVFLKTLTSLTSSITFELDFRRQLPRT